MTKTNLSSPQTDAREENRSGFSGGPPLASAAFADFDTIQVGHVAELERTISSVDVESFARLTGDINPLHIDEKFAARTPFKRPIVHGMLLAGYISEMVGARCPGSGSLWSQQNLRWPIPVFVGDKIRLTLRVTHKSIASRTLAIEVKGVNESGKVFMEGEGVVSVLEEIRRAKIVPIGERVAFIAGAPAWTSLAIASAIAKTGTAVAIGYSENPAEAEDACGELERSGARAAAIFTDFSDPDSISNAVRKTREQFNQPVDILVNNSEILAEPREIADMSWGHIQDALNSHVRSAFLCSQAVIPGMCERKAGKIINIGSTIAWNCPPSGWSGFVIAKSALQALTRSLAGELGPKGIRVNMISPGIPDGEVMSGIPDRLRRVQAMQTPLRRLVSAEDIAAIVASLCSSAGDFITGADIPVCGGFQM